MAKRFQRRRRVRIARSRVAQVVGGSRCPQRDVSQAPAAQFSGNVLRSRRGDRSTLCIGSTESRPTNRSLSVITRWGETLSSRRCSILQKAERRALVLYDKSTGQHAEESRRQAARGPSEH